MTLKELLEKNAAIKAKRAVAAQEQQKILDEAETKVKVTEKISGEDEKEAVKENKGERKTRKPRQRAYLVVDDTVNKEEGQEEA